MAITAKPMSWPSGNPSKPTFPPRSPTWIVFVSPLRQRRATCWPSSSATVPGRLRRACKFTTSTAGSWIGVPKPTLRGASLRELISPPPNTTFYLHVEGIGGSSGAYTLTVVPLKAFDAYEPNDEITRATPLALGRAIDANIMDGDDTDFYSFAVPAAGKRRSRFATAPRLSSPG